MPHCPICETEYIQGQKKCSQCEWDLINSVLVDTGTAISIEEAKINLTIEKAIASGRDMWQKLTQLQASQTPQILPKTESEYKKLEKDIIGIQGKISSLEAFTKEYKQKYFQLQALIKEKENISNILDGLKKEFKDDINTSKLEKEHQQTQKFAKLEARLNFLEKTLRQSHSSNNQAIPVTGALEVPKIIPIKISPEKLREIYHEVPQVLSAYAIRVSLTADSYRKKTSGEIYLEKLGRGNYWVIALEAKDREQYCLFPYGNLTVNLHSLKTVECLFQFKEKHSTQTTEFTVVKPAIVSLLPNGQQWKLEIKGVLDFRNPYRSSSARSQVDKNQIEDSQLQSQIEHLSQENQQLKSQMSEVLSQLKQANEERQQLQDKISLIEQQFDSENTKPKLKQNNSNSRLIQVLVEVYNREPSSLLTDGKEVSETPNSLSDRILKNSQTVIFENKNRGIYSVVVKGNTNYLFPSNNFKNLNLTSTTYKTIEVVFECRGYKIGYYNIFKFVKPAIVIPTSNNQWQLQERGILDFSRDEQRLNYQKKTKKLEDYLNEVKEYFTNNNSYL